MRPCGLHAVAEAGAADFLGGEAGENVRPARWVRRAPAAGDFFERAFLAGNGWPTATRLLLRISASLSSLFLGFFLLNFY